TALAAGTAGWQLVRRPWLPGGAALLAAPGGGVAGVAAVARAVRIDPAWQGPVDVYAGFAGGVGLKLRVDGDPYWTYLTADPLVDVQNWQPLDSICRPGAEVMVRRGVPAGCGLSVAPHPNIHGYTVLTHLRFAPAGASPAASKGGSPAVAEALPARAAAPARDAADRRAGRPFVAGLTDTPDVAYELAADAFHPDAWRETFWQHAVHGI